MKKLFPTTPKLTAADRARLLPHIGNTRTALRPWLRTHPPTDDLKRAVMLEVARAKADYDPLRSVQRGVLDLLLKAIQRNELGEIDTKILKELKPQ